MYLSLKNTIRSILAVGLTVSSMASSAAYYDFTVDETSNGLGGAGNVTADKINGGFVEQSVFSGASFNSTGFATFTQFFANEGTTAVLGASLGSDYLMYSTFSTNGGVVSSLGVNPVFGGNDFAFNGGTGSVYLYLDPDKNTTHSFTTGLGSNTDDILVAFSVNLVSQAGYLNTKFGGFYDLIFKDVQIVSPEGTNYFIDLPTINLSSTVDGDIDSLASFVPVGTQTLTGDASVVFETPEPAGLALLGIGLLGMSAVTRKKA